MHKQRAKITREVEIIYGDIQAVAEMPNNVPLMLMEDGRTAVAYDCDRFIREGTEGWATLDTERGLWTFTPDPENLAQYEDIKP